MYKLAFDVIDDLLVADKKHALQAVLRHCPVALAVCDRDMRYLALSDKWTRDFGLSRDDIIGRSHYDVFPEIENMERWKESYQRVLNGEIVISEAERFERDDGRIQYVWGESHPWYDEDGKVAGIKMFTQVLTDKYAMSTEAKRKQFWSRAAEQMSRIGHWSLDMDSGKFSFSPELYDIYGLKRRRACPSLDRVLDSFHKDDREMAERALVYAIENRCEFDVRLRVSKANGEKRQVFVQGQCRIDSHDQPAELFGIVHDLPDEAGS